MVKTYLLVLLLILLLICLYLWQKGSSREDLGDIALVTFEGLGKNGNFGNQLFQIAAVIGAAEKYDCIASLPVWKYSKYFILSLPQVSYRGVDKNIEEPMGSYTYQPIEIDPDGGVYNIQGYRQSDKYFRKCAEKIRALFTPRAEYLDLILDRVPEAKHPEAIAIHVRRGDYLEDGSYVHCTPEYYLNCIKYIMDRRSTELAPIIICSDDLPYCRKNLGPLLGHLQIIYSPFYDHPDGQVLDLFLLRTCAHQVMAPSSYSWWGAWLKTNPQAMIIAPKPWLKKGGHSDDIYCDNWILCRPDDGQLVREAF